MEFYCTKHRGTLSSPEQPKVHTHICLYMLLLHRYYSGNIPSINSYIHSGEKSFHNVVSANIANVCRNTKLLQLCRCTGLHIFTRWKLYCLSTKISLNRKEPQSLRLPPPHQPGTCGCACSGRPRPAPSCPRQRKPQEPENPLPAQSSLTPRLGCPATHQPHAEARGCRTGPDQAGPAAAPEPRTLNFTNAPRGGRQGRGRPPRPALAIGCADTNHRAALTAGGARGMPGAVVPGSGRR